MKANNHQQGLTKLTLAGVIITLGIVYGDIGTSPLYVFKAIVGGFNEIRQDFILGAVSCIIWTLTIQTTVKYVLITLQADNKGEGGIFALFALIRRKSPWAYVFALIGGSTLLADGIITPSITVTSATEGLKLYNENIPVIPIVLLIITAIFFVQQFGTKLIGKSFGPIMLVWFLMLGILGTFQIFQYPVIFKAFNPQYALNLLSHYPNAMFILGAVFLATTGAEALYSDLGHCGAKNIRISWMFVKATLILNYMGQAAWVMNNPESALNGDNPFYKIMPGWFMIPGILIATAAAIIASQALISGSFTLISEAISLNFWPRFKLRYPTEIKGQIYIPKINWFLWISCCFVVLYFQESSAMEAAYGLSITITMIMTTILLSFYIYFKKIPMPFIIWFLLIYLSVEGTFLYANLQKFFEGGWFTLAMASIFIFIMYFWYNGRKIKNKFLVFEDIEKYVSVIKDLSQDESVPKRTTNLVYITKANNYYQLESKIIYSIINKQPKRADVYWFIHVDILDDPDTLEYRVIHYEPGKMIKVDFKLGFKVELRINQYFKQVLEEMAEKGEVNTVSGYGSLHKHNIAGDFQYILIDRIATSDMRITSYQQFVLDIYEGIRFISTTESNSLGLDTSNCVLEKVPLLIEKGSKKQMKRQNV